MSTTIRDQISRRPVGDADHVELSRLVIEAAWDYEASGRALRVPGFDDRWSLRPSRLPTRRPRWKLFMESFDHIEVGGGTAALPTISVQAGVAAHVRVSLPNRGQS